MSLGDEHLNVLLQSLRNVCNVNKIEYRIIGGAAIKLHGGGRATKDIDIQLLSEEGFTKLANGFQELQNQGYEVKVKAKIEKGLLIKYVYGTGHNDYRSLDARIARESERDIWKNHVVTPQGFPTVDLHFLLVIKMDAAATRRLPTKGAVDIQDAVFCAQQLADVPATHAQDTVIITKEIFDKFIARVPENWRSDLVELLKNIQFQFAM